MPHLIVGLLSLAKQLFSVVGVGWGTQLVVVWWLRLHVAAPALDGFDYFEASSAFCLAYLHGTGLRLNVAKSKSSFSE